MLNSPLLKSLHEYTCAHSLKSSPILLFWETLLWERSWCSPHLLQVIINPSFSFSLTWLLARHPPRGKLSFQVTTLCGETHLFLVGQTNDIKPCMNLRIVPGTNTPCDSIYVKFKNRKAESMMIKSRDPSTFWGEENFCILSGNYMGIHHCSNPLDWIRFVHFIICKLRLKKKKQGRRCKWCIWQISSCFSDGGGCGLYSDLTSQGLLQFIVSM